MPKPYSNLSFRFLTNIKFQFLFHACCLFGPNQHHFITPITYSEGRNYEHVYYTVLSSVQLLPLL